MARAMIFSEDTGPTHFTFAHQIGVQTDDDTSDGSIPDELARTIQSHLWLANLEISSGCTPTMSTTAKMPRQPHPDGPTIMTWHQLEDVHKAIVTAHNERDVSGMLKGVVSNMHLLAKSSREAGFLPYIDHAHYIYECYLKSQINSSHETIFVTTRPEWRATRAPCQDVNRVHMHYCGQDIQLQSVITVSDEGDVPGDSDRHAIAWETLYVPSTPDGADPNQAPTEVAPSTPVIEEGETPSIPETPHYHPDQGDVSPEEPVMGTATRIVAKERMTQTPPLLSRLIQGYLDHTGIEECPYHQMDHGVRDPDCDHCKRALGPLYHHKVVGNRRLPVFTFDFSGPHPHRVNMAQYLLVSVWA